MWEEILLRLYYASLLCDRLERSLQCLTSVLFYLRALLEEGNKTGEINTSFLEFFSLSLVESHYHINERKCFHIKFSESTII